MRLRGARGVCGEDRGDGRLGLGRCTCRNMSMSREKPLSAGPGGTPGSPEWPKGSISGHNRKILWLLSHPAHKCGGKMTGNGLNHQQPRTNKRKGKLEISLVLIKGVNLALWLGGQGSPLRWPWDPGLRVTQSAGAGWGRAEPSCPTSPAPHTSLVVSHSPPGGQPAPPPPGHSCELASGQGPASNSPLKHPHLEGTSSPPRS